MKRVVSILLLHVVLMATFADLVVWTGFAVNTDRIVALFCENTDRPEMDCNGSCHMKKKIEQTKSPQDQSEATMVPVFKLDNVILALHTELCSKCALVTRVTFTVNETYDNEFIGDVFHPPQT